MNSKLTVWERLYLWWHGYCSIHGEKKRMSGMFWDLCQPCEHEKEMRWRKKLALEEAKGEEKLHRILGKIFNPKQKGA